MTKRTVRLPSCPRHNRLLSYAETLAMTCAWCAPGRFEALRPGAEVASAMFGDVAVPETVVGDDEGKDE